jgi:hypothetical protein
MKLRKLANLIHLQMSTNWSVFCFGTLGETNQFRKNNLVSQICPSIILCDAMANKAPLLGGNDCPLKDYFLRGYDRND